MAGGKKRKLPRLFLILWGFLAAGMVWASVLYLSGWSQVAELFYNSVQQGAETGTEAMEEDVIETESEAEAETETSSYELNLEVPGYAMNLPLSWYGKYVEERLDHGTRIYFHKRSREINGDGMMFAITPLTGGGYVNLPSYEIWGYDKSYVYVMTLPTDVTFALGDESIQAEYMEMMRDISYIRQSFQIQSDTARYDGSEFIFPNSNYSFLSQDDLWNVSAEQLRIAKNEIYARHGRRFKDTELQAYFDRRLWYEGTIEAEAFPETMLNEVERYNVRLLQKRWEEIQ